MLYNDKHHFSSRTTISSFLQQDELNKLFILPSNCIKEHHSITFLEWLQVMSSNLLVVILLVQLLSLLHSYYGHSLNLFQLHQLLLARLDNFHFIRLLHFLLIVTNVVKSIRIGSFNSTPFIIQEGECLINVFHVVAYFHKWHVVFFPILFAFIQVCILCQHHPKCVVSHLH